MTRPIVITLCGSSKFKQQHEEAQRSLTLEGKIVIPMGLYGHPEGMDMDGSIKKMLDEIHFRKIDISDEIFVVNPIVNVCRKCNLPCHVNSDNRQGSKEPLIWKDGVLSWSSCCEARFDLKSYIGESTRREIEYARRTGKAIRFLEEPEGT